MGKKVNGIKIYPKYSVGSIINSSLCIVAGVFIIFATVLFPAVLIGEYKLSGLDFFPQGLGAIVSFPDSSVISFTHFLDPVGFNAKIAFEEIDLLIKTNDADISILATFFKSNGLNEIFYMIIGGSSILLVLLALSLIIVGLVRLITGTYPKGCVALTAVSFSIMLFYVLAVFYTSFSIKYMRVDTSGFEGYSFWPYLTWGVLLVSFVLMAFLRKLLIKGKLYVPKARKIKKSRENQI